MDAEQRFLQFQQTREPAHLGAVFDLVADELYSFALHVCRDQAAAEDLVQATFLVALERAHRWDPRRPLRPWLLGILQREARLMRRRARRTPDPARLPAPVEPPPVQVALSTEAAAAVAAGIASVPQPYRAVLELRLVEALENGEIAARLRRSPGAVRTQLWRGLELLRKLLPKGLAVALAAQLGMRPALAAVRQRVLRAAAGPPAVAAGMGLLAGALFMQKVLIGAAAAAVLAAGFWAMRVSADLPTELVAAPASAPVAAADAVPASEPAPSTANQRSLVAGTGAPAAVVGQPAAASAVLVRALVVDGKGDAVADAGISLFEAVQLKNKRGETIPGTFPQPGPPFLRCATDVNGRVEFTIDHECYVEARKDGIGFTGALRAFPGMSELQDEWRLVLQPAQHIRGTVLLPDGSPAAAATVICSHSGDLYREDILSTEPGKVTADERGAFVLEVLPETDCWVRALAGKQQASMRVLTSRSRDEYEVTLRFPGAFSVRGSLYGADGKPTAGHVALVSDPDHPGYEVHAEWAEADQQGRFEKLLTSGGRHAVVGGVEGQTAAHVEVFLDEGHPHQQVELRLTPFVVLAGRVVDEHGQPCAGVLLGCNPAAAPTWLLTCKGRFQGIYARGPSAPDGSFRFLVPDGMRYRLGYQPSAHLFAFGSEVTVPTNAAMLVVRESDCQGFEVAGRVVSAATGAIVPAFRVHLITHGKGGGLSDQTITEGKDGTFSAGPLMVDERYSLRVDAAGFASATIGPFDATVRKEQVTVRMQAFGSVACTVLRADGRPAVKARVGLARTAGYDPFGPAYQNETDRDGRITLKNVPPDVYAVHAYAAAANGGAANVPVTVLPGQESAVQLTLQ